MRHRIFELTRHRAYAKSRLRRHPFRERVCQHEQCDHECGTGTSSSNALPYVFIITDGSQNYQTQWSGNWGAANGSGSWSPPRKFPYQNSATVIPKQSPNDKYGSTDYCSSMKSRGITIAILYIPYQTISDPSTIFDDEDGYANTNIQYIPTALQNCASSNFFYTASTPADINSALVSMFEQAISTPTSPTNF